MAWARPKTELLFIHSAGRQGGGAGSSELLARLKAGLGERYRVVAPAMPDPERPSFARWEAKLALALRRVRQGAVIVGHSLGGAVLLRHFAERDVRRRVRALFVIAAPYWGADGDWDVEEFKFRDPAPQDLPASLWLYHSKDDAIVPCAHLFRYARKFPGARLGLLDTGGHLFADATPVVIDEIRRLSAP